MIPVRRSGHSTASSVVRSVRAILSGARSEGHSRAGPSRWLGNSSPAITLSYYAHFMPEVGDGKAREMGDLRKCWKRS